MRGGVGAHTDSPDLDISALTHTVRSLQAPEALFVTFQYIHFT
jgi:hypothetical protein